MSWTGGLRKGDSEKGMAHVRELVEAVIQEKHTMICSRLDLEMVVERRVERSSRARRLRLLDRAHRRP